MDLSVQLAKNFRIRRRDRQLLEWCEHARQIDAKMVAKHAAAPLKKTAVLRLALELGRLARIHDLHISAENQTSAAKSQREIDRILPSAHRIATFAKEHERRSGTRKEIGLAAAAWSVITTPTAGRSVDDEKIRDQALRFVGTWPSGLAATAGDELAEAIQVWFDAAPIVYAVLRTVRPQPRGLEALRQLDPAAWPSGKSLMLAERLPDLFGKLYPALGYGGSSAAEIRVGPGYTFVSAAAAALGIGARSAEAIRSAKKRSLIKKSGVARGGAAPRKF